MTTLTQPDINQCQAEKPNGANAFTLGGRPGLIRCTEKPVFIATENEPGKDGVRGSMSLCASCTEVALKQLPPDYFTLSVIPK